MNNTFKTLTAAFLLVVTLSACTGDDRDTATTTTQQATATTQPRAEYTLNVCLAEEPASLFFYGDDSAARTILEGIYDGPIDTLGYAYQSSLLEAVPSLANGDTVLADVAVKTGDTIVDAYGSLVAFQPGVTYFPSGCTSADCAVAHTRAAGEQVTMQQLVVSFKIRSGVQWADGEPLRAQDSVFSFETAKNLQAAGYSNLVNHTQSYKALDVRTVEWRGVPGYRHSAYAASFFTPLPKHLLGNMTVEQLLSADQVNRSPLGWGAFQLAEWQPGTAVKLVKNPNYFRSDEGLPYFDAVVFHFTGTDAAQAVDSLLSGQCDVLDPQINLADQADRLLQLQTAGEVGLAFASAGAWEHLDFGIVPLGYDDGYRHVG
ncbi:MAG: ABC transporter substrate-binding protein, partial [Anaerolineae bacterium]|nr:ABC transporter substrate-binding protein [Anaerolineae bacterium]